MRAEDGRAVTCVDISPFIDHLPFGQRTGAFSTEDASGSTSQAASIIEALEGGASALLLDEDTSATNFMIRDARMQALVAAEREPIRPFITRVRSLWTRHSVSTILVVGGSGDFFDVADSVLMLHEYQTSDATARAKEVANTIPGGAPPESRLDSTMPPTTARCVGASGLHAGMKVNAMRSSIRFGELAELDLSGVEQLVEHSQVRAIGEAMTHLAANALATDDAPPLREVLAQLQAEIDAGGLDVLRPGWRLGNLAAPRMLELGAALSRLRSLKAKQAPGGGAGSRG